MNLKEFFDYKNRLFEDLLTNETIVRLINDEKDRNNQIGGHKA